MYKTEPYHCQQIPLCVFLWFTINARNPKLCLLSIKTPCHHTIKISKPRNLSYQFSNRSDVWRASRLDNGEQYAKFQTVWRFLYTNSQLWKLIRVFVCWQEPVVTREFSDDITTFTNRDLVNQHLISDAVKWLQPHKFMRWNYPSIPLFRQTTVVVSAWMVNRLVLQMRAALGGLSRTSGKLSQDYARCCMFLNLKRNIF